MMVFRHISQGFSRFMDSVAEGIIALLGWFASPRIAKLVEQENGEFLLQTGKWRGGSASQHLRILDGEIIGSLSPEATAALRGSRAELVFRPGKFLFRPLELPRRASEFLAGIVRAQIDRLTPWTAADAVFGWSAPVDGGPDRIIVTVAATARAAVVPYVQAIAALGVRSIAVSTLPPDTSPGALPIKVLDQTAHGFLDFPRVRRVLVLLLLGTSLTAGGAVAAAAIIGAGLDSRQEDLSRRIAQHRAAARASRDAPLDATISGLGGLERRKHETLPTVLVLETLSQILPDHTYVTELRLEGDKVRVVGVTRDAPALIGLIEQSGRFSRATFFAPTTRSASDPGERFHIEARMEVVFSSRS